MIGSKILHYQITEKLGEGGMGEVYLAEDERLHRRVALKFLNRTFREDQEAHDRLVREARSASQLSHPNIVSIHAIEETDEHLFIVMEYVEGRSLREVVKGGALDTDAAVDFARQILEALATAHENDIVHRDIKSDNIKVTGKGVVKVLDFGLARSAAAADVTRFGSSAGTPAYMAPEQVHGEKADHRSDLFSFGVVFYEMLTGKRPFKGEHESAVTYSIVNEDPDPLSKLQPDIPSGLQRIIDKLLAKDREQRYQSAPQVLTDLGSVGARQKTGANSPGKKISFRRIAGVTVAALAILALITAILDEEPGEAPPTEPGRIKLVVLPFENLGPTDQEYFADGITEEVITRLAKLSGLGVISRTSAMKYKDSEKSLKEIGEELDVEYALEGTIRWDKSSAADRVRINTQLIRVSDDTHLWADSFDRVFEQIFELESEIAEDVAKALNVTLLEPERVALMETPTENMEAYDLYLKGREMYDRASDLDDYEIATRMVEKAVRLDSTFSLAHALLARYYSNDYFNNRFSDQPRLRQGRQAALAALRHNEDGPEGHVAMGYYHYYGSRDYENALAEFEVAKGMEPNDADMLQAMGFVQRRQGNWRAAYGNLTHALELNPTSLDTRGNVIETALYMRQYREADKQINRAIDMAPDYPGFMMYRAMRLMLAPGDLVTAQAVMTEVEEKFGSAAAISFQVNLYMLQGDYDAVLAEIPNIPRAAQAFGEADSANYYLIKGLMYDMSNGLENESDTATAHYDSARVVWERQLQNRPDDANLHSSLALTYAGLRNKEKAYFHAGRATELIPMSKDALTGCNLLENKAAVKALFGDTGEALDILELLLDVPSVVTPSTLQNHPLLKVLRGNPRFEQLIREKQTL
jgi:serine/threonine protein kinase/Tfp pilus assembly protein PilF